MNARRIKLALTVATPGALPSAFVVYREPLAVSLPKIAAMGYDGVELALLDSTQVNMPELKSLLSDTGLSVPMVSTGQIFAASRIYFSSADQATRQKAEDAFTGLIDVAAELGAMINVGRVRGAIDSNGDRATVEIRVADSLARLDEAAIRSGVVIAMEPVNRYEIDLFNSCAETVSFLEKFSLDRIRLMPDVFHMNIEDPSIEGSLRRFVDRIGYVHFADSNRLYPGAGHLDFSAITGALTAAGYTGWASAEILPSPDPDTAARAAINHLRRYL